MVKGEMGKPDRTPDRTMKRQNERTCCKLTVRLVSNTSFF